MTHMATNDRRRIFISYSHKDRKFLNELKTMLAPAMREGIVDLWDDTMIAPGAQWRAEIAAAIRSARVAVLLVSQNFLASDFIAKHEVLPLLDAARTDGLTVFWIHVRSCLYEHTEIATYQAAHDVSKPLAALPKPKREATLQGICQQLIRLVEDLSTNSPEGGAQEKPSVMPLDLGVIHPQEPGDPYPANHPADQQAAPSDVKAVLQPEEVAPISPAIPAVDQLGEVAHATEDLPRPPLPAPSGPPPPEQKPRSRVRRAVIIGVAVLLLLVAANAGWLAWRAARAEDPAPTPPPLQIYSDVLVVAKGAHLDPDDLIKELRARNYEPTDEPIPGESRFLADSGFVNVALRSFTRPVSFSGRRVRIEFAGGAVRRIANLDGGTDLERVSLEPALVVSVQDPSWVPHPLAGLLLPELSSIYSQSGAAIHGLSVYSTLDTLMQRSAEGALQTGLSDVMATNPALQPTSAVQGMILTIEPKSGMVKAVVGSATTPRRVGSLFQPFIYAAAIDPARKDNVLTAASILDDSKISVHVNENTWSPANDDGRFVGESSLRDALVHARNIPSVRAAIQAGLPNVIPLARAFGFDVSESFRIETLAGGFTATPLQVATAYASLAWDGQRPAVRSIRSVWNASGEMKAQRPVAPARQVVSPAVAYIVNHMLKGSFEYGPAARARVFPSDHPFAGHTGTTLNGADAWMVGYSPHLLSLVWVGLDRQEPTRLTGAGACLPIWAAHVKRIAALTPGGDWTRPATIVERKVDPETGQLSRSFCPAVRNEVFIEGTAPTTSCTLHRATVARAEPPEEEETNEPAGTVESTEADTQKNAVRKLLRRIFGDDAGVSNAVYNSVPPGGTQPVEIDRTIPRYPAEARTNKTEGAVVIRGIVRKNGTIDHLELLKTLPDGLGESALAAVERWRFSPATYQGEPINVYYTVTVNFRLQ